MHVAIQHHIAQHQYPARREALQQRGEGAVWLEVGISVTAGPACEIMIIATDARLIAD